MIPKDPPYRSEKLRRHIASLPCMHCGKEGETQCSHSNQSRDGRGMSYKSHDYRCAALCVSCHHEVDYGMASREEKLSIWEDAHRKTIGELFKRNLLTPV